MPNGTNSPVQSVSERADTSPDPLTQHLGVILLGCAALACVAGVVLVVLHHSTTSSTAAIAAVSSLGSAAVGGIAGVLTSSGGRRAQGTAAQGAPAAATVTTDQSSARAGASFSVSGSGFSPGENVTISLGANALVAATADANGSFSQTERVPPVASGAYTITATGQSSGTAAQAQFAVN
jgi:hypothetical protein